MSYRANLLFTAKFRGHCGHARGSGMDQIDDQPHTACFLRSLFFQVLLTHRVFS